MKTTRFMLAAAIAGLAVLLLGARYTAAAHCDGLDGPVVKAAQAALHRNNVNLVLIWVRKQDEEEVRAAFRRAMAVRNQGPEGRTLADRSFFETVVRLHRASEGVPYTGLQPAGRDLGPAIPAADRALEKGKVADLERLLVDELRDHLRESFERAKAHRKYDPNDLAAGREYVKAYVEYVHYAERLHEVIAKPAEGHFPASAAP